MFKITEEQKKEFYKLYKQGHRGEFISKVTGVSYSYAKKVVRSFDSGDFSWLDHSFRHFENVISEEEKRIIVRELSSTSMSWSDAVSKYGFSEDTLRRWKRNYNKYGVCTRKRGRFRKDASSRKRSISRRSPSAYLPLSSFCIYSKQRFCNATSIPPISFLL